MKFLLFGLGKFIFQMSIVIFIIGYCFGFWFKAKNKSRRKLKPAMARLPHSEHNNENRNAKAH
ncbi:MAG: hypothetical protein HRU28_07635 [Rhizobiales bacterium]|nr:hypothetical protein [Hyphomicrobiales bacterium]